MRAQAQRLNPRIQTTSGQAVFQFIEAQEDSKQGDVPSTIAFVHPVDPHWLEAFFLTAANHLDVFSRVHSVILSGCPLGDAEGARTVRAITKLPALKLLDMTSCMIGPETCAAVAHALVAGASDPNSNATEIGGASSAAGSSSKSGSGKQSATALLSSLLCPTFVPSKLQSVILDANADIGDVGAQYLARGIQRASALTYLSVAFCGIGPIGASAIARALTILYDKLPVEAKEAQGPASGGGPQFDSSTLHHDGSGLEGKAVGLTEEKGEGLVGASALPGTIIGEGALSALSVMRSNAISLTGDRTGRPVSGGRGLLPGAMPLSLVFDGNPLGPAGVAAIAYAGICGVPLKQLNLARTQFANGTMDAIDRRALSALIGCILANPTLESVDIDGVPIGNAGVQSLIDNLGECKHILDIKVTNSVSSTLMTSLMEFLSANAAAAAKARKAKLKRKDKSSATPSLASSLRRR